MSDFPNGSFFAQKKSNRSFSKWANGQPWLQGWAIAHSLIAHVRSFQKSDWAIARLFALLKTAIERSLFLLLFAKEQMRDRSFFALFKRATKRAIALSKRATKRAIALLLFQKERKSENERKMSDFPNCSFFAQKKERSLIFKMSEGPTLLLWLAGVTWLLSSTLKLVPCDFQDYSYSSTGTIICYWSQLLIN